MEARESFRLKLNNIQFQLHNLFNCLVQAGKSLAKNPLDMSFTARWRKRCILFKDHHQFPIPYIPSFLPTLQTLYQKHDYNLLKLMLVIILINTCMEHIFPAILNKNMRNYTACISF